MSRKIFCAKLKQESDGLNFAPYPGELGQRIYDTISQEAWEQWMQRQTMFVNEYRLNLSELSAREFLVKEMENFLFGEGESCQAPSGYVQPDQP